MMILISVLPLAFLLVSFFLPDGTPPLRNRWIFLMYALVVIGVVFSALTWWPHADPTGDPITVAKESMRLAHQNVMLSGIATFLGVTAFMIFLLRCRRAAA
jgi:hypothetical protein